MTTSARIRTGLFALITACSGPSALAGATITPAAADLVLLSAPEDPLMYGTQGLGRSDECGIDGDGSHTVFASEAPQLVPGDRNGERDVFIRDNSSGQVQRLNHFANGEENPNGAFAVTISASGRYVAFASPDNLIANGGVTPPQLYVMDRQTGNMLLASRRTDGLPANAPSSDGRVARGGRFVVFSSGATDLVPGDGNGKFDIFRFDAQTETVDRVSTDLNGVESNGGSYQAGIANGGVYVAFESDATNLVPNDTNGQRDVFVKNMDTGAIERVSVSSVGVEGNGGSDFLDISSDGELVLFQSAAGNLVAGDSNNAYDLFLHHMSSGITERVSLDGMGNQIASANEGRLTGNGNYLVFESTDPALVGATHGFHQAYVKSLSTGAVIQLTSVSDGAVLRTRISGDASRICYETIATDAFIGDNNGVSDVLNVDTGDGAVSVVSAAETTVPVSGGLRSSLEADISADGRFAVFSSQSVLDAPSFAATGDSGIWQVYLRDADSNSIVVVSANALGDAGDDWSGLPRISADGRYVAYQSSATNLGPPGALPNTIYRWDSQNDSTELLSVDGGGNPADGNLPDIDGDGNRVVFHSDTLVPAGDTGGFQDVFLWEDGVGVATLSVAANGDFGNNDSANAAISADGRYVVFYTEADNLVAGMSGHSEMLLRDLQTDTLTRVSSPPGVTPDGGVYGEPSISGDGRLVAFASLASNLVVDDPNGGISDLFIYDRSNDTLRRVPLERVTDPGVEYYVEKPGFSDDGTQLLAWLIDQNNAGSGDLMVRYNLALDHVQVLVGRTPDYPADPWPQPARPSADGTLIAFATTDPLLVEDINGRNRADAYRLHAEALTAEVFTDGFE